MTITKIALLIALLGITSVAAAVAVGTTTASAFIFGGSGSTSSHSSTTCNGTPCGSGINTFNGFGGGSTPP